MTKQQPVLIILIPGFAASEADTTCLPAQQLLVKAFNQLYPELKIIITAFQYPFTNDEYEWYGNRVIPFNGTNKKKLYRLRVWIKVWLKLRRLNKENNIIGVFSCWCGECALVGQYFSKMHRLKHFIWICGQDAKTTNKLVKLIRPEANSLVAISDFLVEAFFHNHQIKPAHTIPIGIDPKVYSIDNLTEKDIDIIGVGSLIALKQYAIFIEIIRELKQYLPDIKVILCGGGPEKEALQNMIVNGGLQHNLLLTGEVQHDEVLALMRRSKVLLHPSAYEGFGAVCMEALFAGAHVISFVKPLHKEIKHWHIVDDKQAMQQKTLEILSNTNNDFSPVLVNDVNASATALMQLFGYA
ncbi:hypothetical protein BH10BAC2_BH10BAC2_47790 [soil metagenome]